MKKNEEEIEAKEMDMHPVLKKLIDRGIPVWKAEFHSAVNNSNDVPENYFSNRSQVKSRHVQMWWINGDGLLCLHDKKYFLVPTATVKDVRFE